MKINILVICLLTFAIHASEQVNVVTNAQSELFPVSIIHMNDFHARLVFAQK